MCLACPSQTDPNALDAFGERLLSIFNLGATNLMISIGFRTGLFEAMRDGNAVTALELAERACLNERYVREWLGAMATAQIVTVDENGQNFALPAPHAAMLSDAPGGDNFAHLAQYLAILGSVEDRIVDCFREGGGVPYSAFPRFHEVMALDSQQTVVGALLDHLLPLVPGLTLSLSNGIKVLDIGCGRGIALHTLAKAFPASEFYGYDLSAEAITYAREQATEAGLTNLRFVERDLSAFDEDAPLVEFDLITAFDAIHDQAYPDRVLAGIQRALKDDGVFFMQDIGAATNIAENVEHPLGPLLYTISCMHCMTVSLAQGGLGLGAMWGEVQTREFLADAGFASVERHTLEHDVQNFYYVVRKSS